MTVIFFSKHLVSVIDEALSEQKAEASNELEKFERIDSAGNGRVSFFPYLLWSWKVDKN